jgi:hypothetical protein
MTLPPRVRKSACGRRFADPARDQAIVDLFRSGKTTTEIAPLFGIGPTAVARVLRVNGVSRDEGGKAARGRANRDASRVAREARFAARHGVLVTDFDSFAQLLDAARKFRAQRKRAAERGIAWEMTLAEWWGVWRASGQWTARGRATGQSAVMARRGDVGPYSVANVYVTTLAGNFIDSHVFRGHRVKGQASNASALSS